MDFNNEYFKKFENDINRAWTKKIVAEFNLQNNKIFKNLCKDLELPTFSISLSEKTWGTWCHSTRTLTLSHNLLRNYEWDAVVHTLKHEMAHMIVSELWGDISDNGNSHGELFNKACQILEVDSKKSHSSEELKEFRITEKDAIVSKIYKLFCLGESNHKAEAELAISKAHEIMIKHNISLRDLPRENKLFVCRPVGEIYKNVPQYVKVLSNIMRDYYFVKHIFCSISDGFCEYKRYLELFGSPQNVDIAEYVYHFLLNEGERQWNEFKQSDKYQNRFLNENGYENQWGCRRRGKYSKVAFLTGLYDGFAETLEKKDEEIRSNIGQSNSLPICLDDPLLEEKYRKQYNATTWHSSGGSNKCGHGEGYNVGKQIKIRNGVSSGIGCRALLA